MKYLFLFFYSVLFFCPVIAQLTLSNSSSKTYAVVVGISSYQDATIDQLQYADADAIAFANFLKSKTGGSIPQTQMPHRRQLYWLLTGWQKFVKKMMLFSFISPATAMWRT